MLWALVANTQLLQQQLPVQALRDLLASLHHLHAIINAGQARDKPQQCTEHLHSSKTVQQKPVLSGIAQHQHCQQQHQHKRLQHYQRTTTGPQASASTCCQHIVSYPAGVRKHRQHPSHHWHEPCQPTWSHLPAVAFSTSATVGHDAAAAAVPASYTSRHPAGHPANMPVVQQAPSAPGTPPRPPAPRQQQLGRQLAARHLRQYLLSINSSGFVEGLAEGIRAGDRLAISRSLTLCESTRPDHALQAAALLRKLIDNNSSLLQQSQQQQQQFVMSPPHQHSHPQTHSLQSPTSAGSGQLPPNSPAAVMPPAQTQQAANTAKPRSSVSLRIGLSGPPGAGKSSLIETWGCYLADQGSRVAVLAVDPSSMESGGAILGDKTRMSRLSSHPCAYVRPSPARGTLGGVSRATFDAMLICEAAGYDRVLVETVGVGQSEVAVADLVDCMMLVMPPVGGDDLQMIKRGIMEVADIVAVNKADGETEKAASRAASEYSGCLHLMPHRYRAWEPQALPVSAHSGQGIPALARLVSQFQQALTDSGELQRCRVQRAESVAWLSLEEQLLEGLRQDPHVRWLLGRLLPMVRAGTMAPRSAADIALAYFYQHCG